MSAGLTHEEATMPTIEFTDRRATARASPATRVLAQVAMAAGAAPPIFNSQPWRWRIGDDVAELRIDRRLQPRSTDPDARILTISCGAALHCARAALAAAGVTVEVTRTPDPAGSDLLARLRVTGFGAPVPDAVRYQPAVALRHTGRRPTADLDVPDAALSRLRAAAEEQGAHLHVLSPADALTLTVAAGPAAVAAAGRRARYAVLFTDADGPGAWLAAGEALSAMLLVASTENLVAAALSDLVEGPAIRRLLRDLVGAVGHPAMALRIDVPRDPTLRTPHRPADQPIKTVPAHAD
jgi:hypothetical protein